MRHLFTASEARSSVRVSHALGATACQGLLVAMDADLGLRRVGLCFAARRLVEVTQVATKAAVAEILR